MFSIDIFSRTPVYEQIISQIEEYVSKGILKPGDKIPSVRALSVKLSVNPNTIQKAFSELDAKGIIFSVPGRGCFIAEDALETVKSKKREKLGDLRALCEELKTAGVTKDEIIERINLIFNNEGGDKK
ncbi:MAG: GntR family transcriptional regulator [Ruminococcaceae bacterium]|nr:GntR family transcriptional regulator [Oscillospiraceae bacterium]